VGEHGIRAMVHYENTASADGLLFANMLYLFKPSLFTSHLLFASLCLLSCLRPLYIYKNIFPQQWQSLRETKI
jgi:hypothetical protein